MMIFPAIKDKYISLSDDKSAKFTARTAQKFAATLLQHLHVVAIFLNL